MRGGRLPALAVATLTVLLAAGGTRSPFPLPDAVQMEYCVHPFDAGVYTVTDRAAPPGDRLPHPAGKGPGG